MKLLNNKKRTGDQLENNLVPMINIIFLLLIFFMVAGRIAEQNQLQKIKIPTSKSEQAIKQAAQEIAVRETGVLVKDNVEMTLDEVKQVLLAAQNKKVQVNLMVDAAVSAGELDKLLTIFREQNWEAVAIYTRKESTL